MLPGKLSATVSMKYSPQRDLKRILIQPSEKVLSTLAMEELRLLQKKQKSFKEFSKVLQK
jgi:hypothetical protein